jgi:hypothetical protein
MTMGMLLVFLWTCQAGQESRLSAPYMEPKGINPGEKPVVVQFQVVYKSERERPETVAIEQIDKKGNVVKMIGDLHDDGKKPDQVRGDGRYSGAFPIAARELGELLFRGSARVGGRLETSEPGTLIVTKFPVGLARSNPKALVEDPKTGEKLYADEILVGFVKGISAEDIDKILAAKRMKVVGTILELAAYQVRIPGDGTAAGVHAAIKALQAHKEVEYAEPNFVTEL